VKIVTFFQALGRIEVTLLPLKKPRPCCIKNTMSSSTLPDHSSEILNRIIRPEEECLSAEAAREILRFRLADEDVQRANELAAKARDGELTTDDRAALDEYERVTAMIELLQSKARRTLRSVDAG